MPNSIARTPVEIGTQTYHYKETLQSLWSGYGEIARYISASNQTVIVKHICPPEEAAHPRGWNTSLSHARKLLSYQIEQIFYKQYSHLCDQNCRVPEWLQNANSGLGNGFVLEDIDASGYAIRQTEGELSYVEACLHWLARFHASFIDIETQNLWPVGGYWHLDTRPDELANMADSRLKSTAPALDKALKNCTYKTLLHGDAKLANFCFNPQQHAAALDFQYVGNGPGTKDVMLLLTSSFDVRALNRYGEQLLDYYFSELRKALHDYGKTDNIVELEAEWTEVYPVAWADYQRFLEGWKPGHPRITQYMQAMTTKAMAQI